MAGCIIGSGIAGGCDEAIAGILRDKIWIFNASEITAYTQVGSTVSALTLVALATGFKLDIHKNTGFLDQPLNAAANSGSSRSQALTVRILGADDATLTAIDSYKNADLVIVYKAKDGNFTVAGQGEGLRLGDGTVSNSGAVAGDDAGNLLVFTGDGFETLAPLFFDTDEATTEATLDSYL